MFSIIDRYIAKQFVINLLGSLLVLVSLFVAVDFLSNLTNVDVAGDVIVRYYKYSIPSIIYQMLPISCIIATIFTLTSLNKANELVALFASGMSLARISAPILICTSLFGAFSFVASDQLLPGFQKARDYILYVEIKKKPYLYATVKTNKIWYRSGNIIFYFQSLNSEKNRAQKGQFYYFDSEWNLVQAIKASSVLLDGAKWKLYNGALSLFPQEAGYPMNTSFKEKEIQINEELADIQTDTGSADKLSLSQLSKFIKKNKSAGLETTQFEVSYHSKFGYAFSCLVLVLLGIPFSVEKARSGGMASKIGICISLVFAFWAANSSFLTLARHGSLPPILGAWGANFILLGIAIYLLLKQKK